MKRRPSREISIFNLSMLDVICSALGAVLILLILSSFSEQSARADAKAKEAQLENLNRALKEANDKLKAARRPGGMAVGMCHTSASQVIAEVYDFGAVDGDRVDFSLNNVDLETNVSLPGQATPHILTLPLEEGANYLGALALDEGSSPPNTAMVIVKPCRDGQPESFKWEMKVGQKRHISIVRESP